MTFLRRLPLRFRVILVSLGMTLLIFTALRVVFWLVFRNSAPALSGGDLLSSFFLGLKYDLRLALLLLCPVVLFSLIPRLDPCKSASARRFWAAHVAFLLFVMAIFYLVDFGHYAYLDERVNVSALRFLLNPEISFQMVWQTYPVLGGFAGLVAFGVAIYLILNWLFSRIVKTEPSALKMPAKVTIVALSAALYVFGIYGKASYYPLRWSDAFVTTHPFRSAVALNPVLFFFDTFSTNEDRPYDKKEVQASYDRVAAYLGVTETDRDELLFARTIEPAAGNPGRPNVVLILLESFSAHHMGVFGNPLDPSPNIDAMSKESVFFRRFYTPRHGTARAVFAILTGTPDLLSRRTASRNPRIVSQYSILNSLRDYEKFYFLGGSANWANIRGLLSHNVEGLHIQEEGSYEGERVDVWGVSDLDLFEHADQVLSEIKDRPFFAIIHTSGNHRPYTIPDNNQGFQMAEVSGEEIEKYGFASLEAYNSFRFMDHCVGCFIRKAETRDYFKNTLFVLVGDHGTHGNSPHMPAVEDELGLGSYHVPFIIYGPGLIKEGKSLDMPANQTDVLPTIASFMGSPTLNTTMGRNLLDPRLAAERYALIETERGVVPNLGLVGTDLYLTMDADGSDAQLYPIDMTRPVQNVADQYPDRLKEMSELCLDLYGTARYMLYHNSPDLYRERLNGPEGVPVPGPVTERRETR